jgi:hypothetical protein
MFTPDKTMLMQLQQSIKQVFLQLTDSLDRLTNEQYTRPSKTLFNATIGQHVRHIIELFICLENGYDTGIVNYEKRKRDQRIEQDKYFARKLLIGIYTHLHEEDRSLLLEANYNELSEELILIPTNYYREIVYNLEHTVHHMALIRVGINEVSSIELPAGYGVAASTIKHQKACAQ